MSRWRRSRPYFGPDQLATLHILAAPRAQEMVVERFYVELEVSLYGEFTDGREGMTTVPNGPAWAATLVLW